MDTDLTGEITELVTKHWNDHNAPILLSQLGQGEIGSRAKKEAGSLIAFVQTRMAGKLHVIRHSAVAQVVGVLPAEVAIEPGSEDALLDRTRSNARPEEQRFHPAFWAAFLKPLDSSAKRFLWRDPTRFRDVVGEGAVPDRDQAIEIHRKYIIEDAEPEAVRARIQQWQEANDTEVAPFLARPGKRDEGLPADDILGRMLEVLEVEDLRRLSMPMDIVNKLRRHRR